MPKQEMKVAYLVNHYPKVSHSFIRREIQALEALGMPVVRISTRGWDDKLVDQRDVDERERTQYLLQKGAGPLLQAALLFAARKPGRMARALWLATRLGLRGDRSLLFHWIYFVEACLAAKMVSDEGAVHLHAHFGTNSATVAMLAAILAGIPFSFTVHGPEEFERARGIGLKDKVEHAAFVVAISSFGRSQIYRWIDHLQWPKAHIVHCGLDAGFHDVQGARIQRVMDRFVCVGRLCEEKGQMLLLAALRVLLDRGCKVELVLAGDGELRGIVDESIRTLQLDANVRITGWISSEQVRTELLSARAMVLPSFAEGLPVVIMEAMVLERPVISTYVAGIPELVVPSLTGWLVPPGDVELLADAMQSCLTVAPAALERMGVAAKARVMERHDVVTEARKLRSLFENAAKR